MTAPVEVQLAEIRGEISTLASGVRGQLTNIDTKLEAGDRASAHLFELLKESLGHIRDQLEAIKANQSKSELQLRGEINAVRVDLQRQVGEVIDDLAAHIGVKNPHALQEEWLRGNTREVASQVEVARAELEGLIDTERERVDGIVLEQAHAKGTARAWAAVVSFGVSVLLLLIGAVVSHFWG